MFTFPVEGERKVNTFITVANRIRCIIQNYLTILTGNGVVLGNSVKKTRKQLSSRNGSFFTSKNQDFLIIGEYTEVDKTEFSSVSLFSRLPVKELITQK